MKGKTKKYSSTRNTRIAKPKPETSMSIRNRNLQSERGRMEGLGIFKDIGKWLAGAARTGNKWLKKTHIISKAGPVVGKLVGSVYPQAGKIIGDAAKFAGQHGYGISLPAGGGRAVKSITPTQQKALRAGYGKLLKGGGISLVTAKKLYPTIKNITPAQWNAVRGLRARNMKGGGYSFVKGVATAPQSGHAYTNVTGRKNVRNVKGAGIKLAGQGVTSGGYKKKRRIRRKPAPMRM